MKKIIWILLISLVCSSWFEKSNGFVIDQWIERSMVGNYIQKNSTSLHSFFSLSQSPKGFRFDTNPLRLKKIAEDTLLYIKKHQNSQGSVLRPFGFTRDFMSLKKVKETLTFIVDSITQDELAQRPYRICNPDFINKNFGFIKWGGDAINAKRYGVNLRDEAIHLTKYTVYNFTGSYFKTKEYCCALYGLRNERKVPRCTKQDVVAGLLEHDIHYKNAVKPFAWLTREGLEEALMQGTIFVLMLDGKKRAFNVHRNNGFMYDKKICNPWQQKRYWFFREIQHNSVQKLYQRYEHRKEVVFAGDIHAIGIGKVVAICYKNLKTKKQEIKLGVLADTGNAFNNNLYQLDFFVGISKNKKRLYQSIKKYPEFVRAYILYKKNHHA